MTLLTSSILHETNGPDSDWLLNHVSWQTGIPLHQKLYHRIYESHKVMFVVA